MIPYFDGSQNHDKTLTKVLFCFFSLIISYHLSAQVEYVPGYIINFENDTIYGEIAYKTAPESYLNCTFLQSGSAVTYTSEKINGYGYVGLESYKSGLSEELFSKVLVTGKMSFYSDGTKYYVSKEGETTVLESKIEEVKQWDPEYGTRKGFVESSRWRGIFSYLLNDCLKNSSSLVQKARYSQPGSFVKLVDQDNNCSGSESIIHDNKPKKAIEVGINVGYYNSLINFRNAGASRSDFTDLSVGHFTYGVYGKVQLSYKVSLQVGFDYMLAKYESSNVEELSIISIPLGFNFEFPAKKFTPLLQAGANLDNNLGDLPEFRAGGNRFPVHRKSLGVYFGGGLQSDFGKIRASITTRYYYMPQLATEFASSGRYGVNLMLTRK